MQSPKETDLRSPTYESYVFDWKETKVVVRYCTSWTKSDVDGFHIAHLEIISPDRLPLPMTETGYKSQFLCPERIEAHGGATEYVLAWLDEAANDPKWKAALEQSRQGQLF
ncbi:hypothetical protein [uncultured Tateyamaria sp.]|uniref:hypothetical protein n=1 Tax=uncultured Tateyamaria sp. TaxID=455651 RepID=UPI00261452AC|nr:hypothetical protein [uncultured Tateyamaria sp.]